MLRRPSPSIGPLPGLPRPSRNGVRWTGEARPTLLAGVDLALAQREAGLGGDRAQVGEGLSCQRARLK